MTTGDKLFARLRGRSSALALDAPATPAPGLQLQLDNLGQVLSIAGSLRPLLDQHLVNTPNPPLRTLLCPSSALSVEGAPPQWQRQGLDLDFQGAAGLVLHTRGWLEPEGDAWALHLLDITDLLADRARVQQREQNH